MLFLFLDGVGLGVDDAEVNPFVTARTPFMRDVLGGRLTSSLAPIVTPAFVSTRLDATLGHDGLPQSATGQSSLLTGKNAANVMEGHYGPWPGPTLKTMLDAGTLFHEVKQNNQRAGLLNAYPPGYFQALASKRRRLNVPAYACLSADVPLLTVEDYRANAAVSADLTGAFLQQSYPELPARSPAEAGALLAQVASGYAFSFFDFWLTDDAGHRWAFNEARTLIETLDGFLSGLLPALGTTRLIITSDHGNIEDKRVKTHTRAPVPLVVVGDGAEQAANAKSIQDVAPLIRQFLNLKPVTTT